MAQKQEYNNIRTYKKRWNFNIGVAIFGIMFLYLMITVILYLTKDRVSSYEVREGSILKDRSYTGLALREEMVVNADASGYLSYYVPETNKVRVASVISSISESEISSADGGNTDEKMELTSEQEKALLLKFQSFTENFDASGFEETYTLKEEINTTLQSISSDQKIKELHDLLENQNTNSISIQKSVKDGIVIYSVDGFEDKKVENATEKDFDFGSYEKTYLDNRKKITAGDPMYKLITNETWSLLLKLDKETASELKETSRIQVHFKKDNQTIWGNLEIIPKAKYSIGKLTFKNSMVRYAKERFLDVDLILADQSGLKIPKSAVTEKDVYCIPAEYLQMGANSNNPGIYYKKSEGAQAKFVPVTICYRELDEDKNENVYILAQEFDAGGLIVFPDTQDTAPLPKKQKMSGVYNINKGYAQFKRVEILCESEDYYIVKNGSAYGLSNYDHIALDGNTVKEDDIVFQ